MNVKEISHEKGVGYVNTLVCYLQANLDTVLEKANLLEVSLGTC